MVQTIQPSVIPLDKPSFGMITTGKSFIFIKLVKGETPQYALSDEFVLRKRGNELYSVLSILKRLGQLISDLTI